ncbi:hypothetical protein Airi01_021450 [Actinoallomurus iriomotensis]|uniref:Uncharacterized protein n=1 Tax=Actinoallomurus iriomotensis TaxID=478107 RepID=A0A9W6RDM6_9ACTN|nr:hypothetical protein Airi01_021450 [Actinoallomurus iriomotensis]
MVTAFTGADHAGTYEADAHPEYVRWGTATMGRPERPTVVTAGSSGDIAEMP